jgi:probable rRNA maturation factor
MNRVEVSAEEVPLPPWSFKAHDYVLKVLERLDRDGWDLSVLFCGDGYIRSLNSRFRNQDEATDVLSFALGETLRDDEAGERYLPGDIVISLETLEANARYFRVSEDEELRRLLVHGILHLDGLDHHTHLDAAPLDAAPLDTVPLGAVSLGAVSLGAVSLGAVSLGAVSLGAVSLGAVSLDAAPLGAAGGGPEPMLVLQEKILADLSGERILS